MIENKENQNSGTKSQKRRGGLFTNRNKRVKGGLQQATVFRTQNLDIIANAKQEIAAGGLSYDPNPFSLAGDESQTSAVALTNNGLLGFLAVLTNLAPTIDNFYQLGGTNFAWSNVIAYAFPAPSDRRLKKDIKGIKYGLETINELNPVSFKYKNDLKNKTRLGLIAQETKEIIPEIIHGSEIEKYGISYDELIPILIKSVQELSKKVEELEKDKK